MKKEMKELMAQAIGQGWTVTVTNGNHYKWVAPNGKIVFSSKTPSDFRAMKNLERDLRINGLVFVKKGR